MSIFFYSNKKNIFHKLDPRIKILCLILLFANVILIRDIKSMFIFFLFLILLFLLSESIKNLQKILPLFLLIGMTTFILWVIFYKGEMLDEKYYVINKNALSHAAFLTLRLLNMLLAGLWFLSITSYEDFSYGLMRFGLPYSIAFTFLLSFKLVDLFMNTAFLIAEAQKVRGNDVTKGNIFHRIKAYTPLVVPLILNGIKKAKNLILALETRGFSPKNKINIKGKYTIKLIDILFLFIITSVIILIKKLFSNH